MANWSLLMGGQNIFTMPRVAVLRGMVMNHLIHHRGQLTVYFRMLDIPVPGLYGPSGAMKSSPAPPTANRRTRDPPAETLRVPHPRL